MFRVLGGVILLVALVSGARATTAIDTGYRLLRLDGHDVKWGEATFGTGATLRYAVLDTPTGVAGTAIAGTRNCRAVTGVGPMLKKAGLSRAAFDAALAKAFNLWEAAADIRFRPVAQPDQADLIIAAESLPDGIAYTDLATDRARRDVPSTIRRAIICLNPSLAWTTAPALRDGAPAAAPPHGFDLVPVLAHEAGHALGLDHPGPSGEIMAFRYDDTLHALQTGDVAGIVRLYGPHKAAPAAAATAAFHATAAAP